MDFVHLLTRFDGRINRAKYWLGGIVVGVIFAALLLAIAFSLGASVDPEDKKLQMIGTVLQLIFLYPSSALMAKRFHDRNRPGYFAAFLVVPVLINVATNLAGVTGDPYNVHALDYALSGLILVVFIWFFVELGCLRGTIGDNRYGPDPLAGKV